MKRVALLTDFGTRAPYVAAMKGVIAARTNAPIVDLTHEIAPFDVFEAAWFLRAVAPYWRETIFVCVVDPGVGTSRRIVCVERDGNIFLAPDNGLLTLGIPSPRFVASLPNLPLPQSGRGLSGSRPLPLAGEGGPERSAGPGEGTPRFVQNDSLFLPDGSTTFHGRDRFAPIAAAIANGLRLDELGPHVDDLVRLDYDEPTYGDDVVRGTIVVIDRFGNLITDIERTRVRFDAFAIGEIDRVEMNYGDAAPGAFLIVGSTGCLEISMRNANAAQHLQLSRGSRVELCRIAPHKAPHKERSRERSSRR